MLGKCSEIVLLRVITQNTDMQRPCRPLVSNEISSLGREYPYLLKLNQFMTFKTHNELRKMNLKVHLNNALNKFDVVDSPLPPPGIKKGHLAFNPSDMNSHSLLMQPYLTEFKSQDQSTWQLFWEFLALLFHWADRHIPQTSWQRSSTRF